MKKVLFFVVFCCSSFSFGSGAVREDVNAVALTERKRKPNLTIQDPDKLLRNRNRNNEVHANPEQQQPPIWLMVVSVLGFGTCLYFNDSELTAVRELGVNCSSRFNATECADSTLGCKYRECVDTACCNDSNQPCSLAQSSDFNLSNTHREALRKCHRWRPGSLYKNYSKQNPRGYAQQQCWNRNNDPEQRAQACRTLASKSLSVVTAGIAALFASIW